MDYKAIAEQVGPRIGLRRPEQVTRHPEQVAENYLHAGKEQKD